MTYEEKQWLDSINALCHEHIEAYSDKSDLETQGLTNLCNALLFSYEHLNFEEVTRPTLH